jgi:CRISPR/Cas system CMR-associated protein Cmr3 (group 5 of RAMP superfamily)
MISRSIYNLKIDTICMRDIPFDRSILQLSNGIRHVMPYTDRKLELTAKASMAQPVSQPAVCSNGLREDALWSTFLKST